MQSSGRPQRQQAAVRWLARAADEAGMSGDGGNGLHPDRVRPFRDAATARFQRVRQRHAEPTETGREMEEREVIDRAEGLAMTARGIPEACSLLCQVARVPGRHGVDLAEALVSAARLLS